MPLQIGEDGPEDEDEAEFERTIEIRRCGRAVPITASRRKRSQDRANACQRR